MRISTFEKSTNLMGMTNYALNEIDLIRFYDWIQTDSVLSEDIMKSF